MGAGPSWVRMILGWPQLLPPTSCCCRSASGAPWGSLLEFSIPRLQGIHRPAGPASLGTWRGHTVTPWWDVWRGLYTRIRAPQTASSTDPGHFSPLQARNVEAPINDVSGCPAGRKPGIQTWDSQITEISQSIPKSALKAEWEGVLGHSRVRRKG